MHQWINNGGVGVHRDYFLRCGDKHIGGVSMNHRRGSWNIYVRVSQPPYDTVLYTSRKEHFLVVCVGSSKTADEARARLLELALETEKWDRLRDERHIQIRQDERARTVHIAAGKLNAQQIQRIARLVRQQNDPEWDDIKATLEDVP